MADERVLITGSSGLIGVALCRNLAGRGIETVGVDLRASDPNYRIDVRDLQRLAPLLDGISGIIHLAAVSRVIEGERNPELCRAVNVDATRDILNLALHIAPKPWFIYASSREVYGLQDSLPVNEDAHYRLMNVYAHTKIAAEVLVGKARAAGLTGAVVRFSNVYGSIEDHADRVVPAFVVAALTGGVLRVDGYQCMFDLSYVEDVANGVARVVEVLMHGEQKLPPIHFVSGRATTLLELAQLTNAIAGHKGHIVEAASRAFDVHRFVGHPGRARSLLGWHATTKLEAGLSRLAGEYARAMT